MLITRSLILFTISLLFCAQAYAQKCLPWAGNNAGINHLEIGDITIHPLNIFNLNDPLEQAWFHKLGNQLHIKTKERTVKNQLLFSKGDKFDLSILDETERLLRKRAYLKDSNIKPVEICGTQVNINVATRDLWTLTPSIKYDRTGDEDSTTFEIEEENLFGSGKSLHFLTEKNADRDEKSFGYSDPALFSSRKSFDLSLSDNSDGQGHHLSLGLPFYELDSRFAWEVATTATESSESLYSDGEIADQFHTKGELHQIALGWSDGLKNTGIEDKAINRFRIGWNYQTDKFSNLSSTQGTLPNKRMLSYPWIGIQHINNHYIQIPNLTLMDRSEDVALGHNINLTLGFASTAFGSEDNYVITTAKYTAAFQPSNRNLTKIQLSQKNFFGNGALHNSALKVRARWYHFLTSKHSLELSGKWFSETRPTKDKQYLLGGDRGMRGFPLRHQNGNRLALVTAEHRYRFDWHPYHLLQFSSAVFIDVGSAWQTGEDPEILADVGFGVRIYPTKSTGGNVIQVDVAFPLNAPDEVDEMQFLVKTKRSF